MDYVVLYSSQQVSWHIETLKEYESKPNNGYCVEAIFKTYEECLQYIKRQTNG